MFIALSETSGATRPRREAVRVSKRDRLVAFADLASDDGICTRNGDARANHLNAVAVLQHELLSGDECGRTEVNYVDRLLVQS